MQMQMRAAVRLVAFACLSACAVARQPLPLAPGVPDCAELSATAGLRVYLPARNGWDEFSFKGGKLVQIRTSSTPDARIRRNDPDVAEQLQVRFPQQPRTLATGEQLGFPAALSPDTRYWAAAISSGSPEGPNEFVIDAQREVHRIVALPGFRIETLQWSPQSEYLAVVQMNYDNRARTFKDIIAPHGAQYSDVVLRLYTPSGQVSCQATIAEDRYSEVPLMEWR